MRLKYPFIFIITLISLIIYLVYRFYRKRKHKKVYFIPNIELFAKLGFNVEEKKHNLIRRLQSVSFIILILLSSVLLSRPQRNIPQEESKYGLDLVYVMDGSGSITMTDIAPSRLEAIRQTIINFVDELENDRVALIAFGESPMTLCPLTYDYSIIKYYMEMMVDDKLMWFIPGGGTAVGDGLLLATQKFDEQPNRTKVIILLTDGESNLGIDPMKVAKYAKKENIKIYTIFVNTSEYSNAFELMQNIASTTEGKFYQVTSQNMLEEIFREIETLEKSKMNYQTNEFYIDDPNLFIVLTALIGIFYLSVTILLKYKNGTS